MVEKVKAAVKAVEVTVGELIRALQTLNPSAKVHMASDPEGNAIRKFSVVSVESHQRVCLWPGAEVAA